MRGFCTVVTSGRGRLGGVISVTLARGVQAPRSGANTLAVTLPIGHAYSDKLAAEVSSPG